MSINAVELWLIEETVVLNCKIGRILFVYFGLAIGNNPCRLSFWDPLIGSIGKRCYGCKTKSMCFGGRLVLLKHVLSSLTVYFISFFNAPTCIIYILEFLFKKI